MTLYVGMAVVLVVALCTGKGLALDEQQLEQRLGSDLPEHPRLFWRGDAASRSAVQDRWADDAVLAETWRKVQGAADGMLALPPVQREVTGRRLLDVSRRCLKRVMYLSMAWRVTGDRRYVQRAEAEMLAAAAFSDWNPSHFLDVGEMTAALAVGYDWLYDELDEDARRTIRRAIVDKGLNASFEHPWPVDRRNNWNQVCHAGLVLGALAVAEDEPTLAARVVRRAVQNVPHAMAAYEPDGAYPEGPSYWDYGTSFNVLLIDALETALGDDFGLADRAAFLPTADYFVHATGPTNRFFNYADGGDRRSPSPAQAWLARRRDEPGLAWHEARTLRGSKVVAPGGQSDRLLPLMLLWAEQLDDLPEPAGRSFLGRGDTPVGMHRSGWDGEAVFVGLKGGKAAAPHGQMDVGQFVHEADGVRWSVDLGADDYHALESRGLRIWTSEQDGDRWKVFRYNNRSHSTLTVDDKLHLATGFAPIVRHAVANEAGDGDAHTVIDMSAAFDGQLASAWRGVKLLADGGVLVQDELQGPEDAAEAATVRWVMATPGELESTGPGEAVLTAEGRRLHLRVLGLDAPPTFETWSLEGPNEWDAPNRGRRRVGFEVRLQPGERVRWSVLLTPGSAMEPALRPMSEWSAPLP